MEYYCITNLVSHFVIRGDLNMALSRLQSYNMKRLLNFEEKRFELCQQISTNDIPYTFLNTQMLVTDHFYCIRKLSGHIALFQVI